MKCEICLGESDTAICGSCNDEAEDLMQSVRRRQVSEREFKRSLLSETCEQASESVATVESGGPRRIHVELVTGDPHPVERKWNAPEDPTEFAREAEDDPLILLSDDEIERVRRACEYLSVHVDVATGEIVAIEDRYGNSYEINREMLTG